PVGESRGDAPHERALGAVAVPTAAEDADEAPARDPAGLREHVRECLRGVRVVDEHREALPLVDRLEAARDPTEVGHTPGDRRIGDPEKARRGDGADHVLDVEASAEARLQLDTARSEAGTRRRQLEALRADVGVLGKAEGQRFVAERSQPPREPSAVVVAYVDGRRGSPAVRTAVDEEPTLRVEVALERPVEVEVILAQVREDERREPDAAQALELRGV